MKQIKTTLYALNKNGSHQKWHVYVDGNTIFVHFGQDGGATQVKKTVCTGKNVGRSNETTDEEQAVMEAISKWEKQARLGYKESKEELVTDFVMSPMLACDALKKPNAIKYPCFGQPKLDGLRCLVTFDENDNPIFNSRGNKEYAIKGKIVEQIKDIKEKTNFDMLDGEVYIHGLPLQKIGALVKKWRTYEDIETEIEKDYQGDIKRRNKAIKDGSSTYKNFAKLEVSVDILPERDVHRYGGYESADLQFHIFDVPSYLGWDSCKSTDNTYHYYTLEYNRCRYSDLMNLDLISDPMSHIKVVMGNYYNTEDEVKAAIGFFMESGYEGIIVRNLDGVYEFGQRSNDLIKWKIFQTTEAFVNGYTIDKNNELLLECVLQSGVKFGVKMKGSHAYRSTCTHLVNKFITISFQAYTVDGAPQFAVGISERDVNPETWEPLE